jgi:hypothetical protein
MTCLKGLTAARGRIDFGDEFTANVFGRIEHEFLLA